MRISKALLNIETRAHTREARTNDHCGDDGKNFGCDATRASQRFTAG